MTCKTDWSYANSQATVHPFVTYILLSPDFLFPRFLVFPPANPSSISHCSIRITILILELCVFSTVKHNVMIKLFIVHMSCVYIGTLKYFKFYCENIYTQQVYLIVLILFLREKHELAMHGAI